MRKTLRTRFALIFSSLTTALLVLVAGTLIAIRANDQTTFLGHNAEAFAKTTHTRLCDVWKLYYGSGSYKFRQIVRDTMALNPDLQRILILSVSGEVLYDSYESPDLMLLPEPPKRRLADPEYVAAAGNPMQWQKKLDVPGFGRMLMIGMPYFEEWGRHPYSVLYVFGYQGVKERVASSLKPALLMVLGGLVIVTLASNWVASRVTRPIVKLTDGVRAFMGGNDVRILGVKTADELQELAEAFNLMAERIQQQVDKLEKANKDLATLDRLKTDLLANVSHELRTPLAAIRGYVEFIHEGQLGPTTEAQRKGLEVCLRNSERLTKTINMLLDFSRMELGRVTIRPAPFQMGRLIAQVVAGVEGEARKRRIQLRMRVDRDLKAVEGDRDRLTQVLENLLTNALKFTPDGGEVEIGAKGSEGGSRVEVWVSDNGIGIPAEERARVFDKFYQADATATRKFGGIGLGLAIVKSILDAHQAGITVDGREGGGTLFRFSLRAVEARTESGVFYGLLPTESAASEILAIDDDPDFLSIIRETLSKHGFSVRSATTAAEGLAAAREHPPLLILLDIRLPDRDGLDLLQELRQLPETARTPILVASVVDERLEGLRLGAVEYLVKPIDRGRLVEAALRALNARSGPSSSGSHTPVPRA